MAMKKREPGFMGLAKQNAKRKGMVKVPRRHNIKGEAHYPVFVTAKEMKELKLDGGSGEMTEYGIPAYPPTATHGPGTTKEERASATTSPGTSSSGGSRPGYGQGDGGGGSVTNQIQPPGMATQKVDKYKIGYDSNKSLWENIKSIDIPGWIEQEWDKLDFSGKPSGDLTEEEKLQSIQNNPDAQQQVMGNMGGPEAAAAAEKSATEEAYEADRKEDYEKKQEREGKRQGFLDEYKGFQGEAKGLQKDAKGLTEGVMTDASGKVEGQEGYDASSAEMKGGFAGDVKKLGAYEDKFGDIAADAKTRGDTAQTEFGSAASTGAGKLEGIGEKYKDVTGQAGVDASKKGAAGFEAGATDVGTVKDQFGKEGFQKDVRGMSEKALSGDVGQREAGMLKGRMEEQRMASQKGSEEKLRREMAQSGASPAEIASKVAQFQRQSAAQQQQAGRSEALSSQLQGQQMGQSQLSQAAQLKGQEAGLAGKQAGLAVQQASLKGQGAAMEMQGAQAQDQTKLASLQGQGAMAQAGAGMRMEGVKGGAELGMAGAAQQGSMLGQAVGAVQAAGGAREQQMQGVKDQGGFIDQQGNYVQAQLASTESDITQASTEEQARLTREAQGTPDAPRYRPPAETVEAGADGLPPGTTTAQPPPGPPVAPPPSGTVAPPPPTGGRSSGRDAGSSPDNPTYVSGVPSPASAVAAPGGINAAPAKGAPPQGQGGGMDNAQAQHSQMKASLNAQRQNMNPQQLQESQAWEKNYDAFHNAGGGKAGMAAVQQGQQGGLMGQQGMMQQGMMGSQAPMGQGQGNNQQAMMQNQAEATKQMGQAGAVRGSWKDAQGGGGAPGGGGFASMMGGGGGSPFGQGQQMLGQDQAMMGQGQAGIAQQGGLMGQNANMDQQGGDEMARKKRQAMMQGFAGGGV